MHSRHRSGQQAFSERLVSSACVIRGVTVFSTEKSIIDIHESAPPNEICAPAVHRPPAPACAVQGERHGVGQAQLSSATRRSAAGNRIHDPETSVADGLVLGASCVEEVGQRRRGLPLRVAKPALSPRAHVAVPHP